MGLDGTDFARTIVSKIEGIKSKTPLPPITYNSAIASGITEYINSKVRFKAINVTSGLEDNLTLIGVCKPIIGVDFITWSKSIELNIMSGFLLGPGTTGRITPASPIPVILPGLNLIQSDIGNSIKSDDNKKNPLLPIWKVICGKILEWMSTNNIKGFPSLVPGIPQPVVSTLETVIISK